MRSKKCFQVTKPRLKDVFQQLASFQWTLFDRKKRILTCKLFKERSADCIDFIPLDKSIVILWYQKSLFFYTICLPWLPNFILALFLRIAKVFYTSQRHWVIFALFILTSERPFTALRYKYLSGYWFQNKIVKTKQKTPKWSKSELQLTLVTPRSDKI